MSLTPDRDEKRRSGSKSDESDDNGPPTEGVYEVDIVLDYRVRKTKREFKIRWKGYDSADDTWEPEDNLETARESVDAFLRRQDLPLVFDGKQKKPTPHKSKSQKSVKISASKKRASSEKTETQTLSGESKDADDDDDYEGSSKKRPKRSKTGSSKSRSSPSKTNGTTSGSGSKFKQMTLQDTVKNRGRIMGTPRWLDESDDGNDGKSDEGSLANKTTDKPVEDKNGTGTKSEKIVDDELQKNDGGADNETGMELDETRSEHLDMLKDNERSERALKSSEKTPKGRNAASSSSKTEKNQQKALSTTKMNGNEKPKKRAEKKTTEINNVVQSEQPSSSLSKNITIKGIYRSAQNNQLRFIARNNTNLEEETMEFQDALEANSQSLATFLFSLVNFDSGMTAKLEDY